MLAGATPRASARMSAAARNVAFKPDVRSAVRSSVNRTFFSAKVSNRYNQLRIY